MGKPYKLSVRIGLNEFNGEGDELAVRADYQKFIDKLSQSNPPRPPQDGARAFLDALASHEQSKLSSSEKTMLGSLYATGKALTVFEAKEICDFDLDARTLSLKNYPACKVLNKSDALMLLLWGFKLILSSVWVAAADLTNAAHESGLVFDRLDRVVAPNRDCIEVTGETRGTKYGLTPYGEARAIWLANRILKTLEKESPGR